MTITAKEASSALIIVAIIFIVILFGSVTIGAAVWLKRRYNDYMLSRKIEIEREVEKINKTDFLISKDLYIGVTKYGAL